MTDLDLRADLAPTTLFATSSPAVVVQRATEIADAIAPLIRDRNLYKRIGKSEHVYVEAWALAGSMLGVFATTVRTWEIGDDDGYGATVEARTLAGAVVGRADAVVLRNEAVGTDPNTGQPIRKWLEAPAFQLISMAQTRGSSKALRMPLGFVMKLAGYETTPAEEMEAAAARGETVSGGRGVRPGWRDVQEQQRAHADLGVLIDEHNLRPWVAEYCDSKGYERPLAKAQFNQLKRAIDRELVERAETARGGADGARDAGEPHAGGTAATTGPTSPSAPEQEEASELARSRAEGANHKHTEPGAGLPPGTITPPEGSASPPARPSGGTNRPAGEEASGPRSVRGRQTKPREPSAGRTTSLEGLREEAQQSLEGDPARFTR